MVLDPVVIEMAAHYWGASSLYVSELGYKARDPRETLRDTVDWLRAHHEALRQEPEPGIAPVSAKKREAAGTPQDAGPTP